MVWAVGDSHSRIFEEIPGVECFHIGPRLMYSVGHKGLKSDQEETSKLTDLGNLELYEMGIKEGDTVIFCLGEIDCRCHVWNHSKETPYQQVIENIIEKYIQFILDTINYNMIKACVYNVVPPKKSNGVDGNGHYPFTGTNEERRSYHLYMNYLLKEYCYKHEILFIDIYDNYTTSEGFLIPEQSDGCVHIKNPYFVERFLKKHSII